MPAPADIIDLITRFEQHLDAYKAGQYNETQLRRDFLDPFFYGPSRLPLKRLKGNE